MLTLIEHGTVYAPEPMGIQSVLLAGDRILRIGPVDRQALLALDLPCTVVDASGCVVTPGLIDPHEHLIGAGGEQGFASRMPDVPLETIVLAGVTTVVGCLGTDTTARHLTALLAKVRQLEEQGLSAYMYTGGFPVPPPTITASVTDDLVVVDKVIGVGEIAIADTRSAAPSVNALAHLVSAAYVGGLIAGKAGVTHLHVGSGRSRLSLLHALLDQHEIPPECLYATHVNRSRELMDEAIVLSRRGSYVDVDTIAEDLPFWLGYYREHGGAPGHLTASSDAHTPGGTPAKVYAGVISSIREHGMPLADVLPIVTVNPATALKLRSKGCLVEGMDADVLVLKEHTLELVHVFARGQHLVKDGMMND